MRSATAAYAKTTIGGERFTAVPNSSHAQRPAAYRRDADGHPGPAFLHTLQSTPGRFSPTDNGVSAAGLVAANNSFRFMSGFLFILRQHRKPG